MATYSSILAWRIPWTEEPGGLQSMGSQRVRHDRATNTTTVVSSESLMPKAYNQNLLYIRLCSKCFMYIDPQPYVVNNMITQFYKEKRMHRKVSCP